MFSLYSQFSAVISLCMYEGHPIKNETFSILQRIYMQYMDLSYGCNSVDRDQLASSEAS